MKVLPDGVIPTMITPFTAEREVDYVALDAYVEWSISRGVSALFAVCQSSEMFFLSLRERLELAQKTVVSARGKVPVIASGHVTEKLAEQIDELKAMADTGVNGVVLITNRFTAEDEPSSLWQARLEKVLRALPADLLLGFYECPAPYKRVLSAPEIKFLASTGRVHFLKDTCCEPQMLRERAALTKGTGLKLYNANAATLLLSLQAGYAGYSGVMANFYPEIYVELCKNFSHSRHTQAIADYLGFASVMERQLYPINAKYCLNQRGVSMSLESRRQRPAQLSAAMQLEVDQFMSSTELLKGLWEIK